MSDIIENDIDAEHAIQILREIKANKNLRKVTLVAENDGEKFSVHRLMMMSSSDYFRARLGPNFEDGKKDEFMISNTDGPTLRAIIGFCYSGKIQITVDNIVQIIDTASLTGLDRIERKCEQFWIENLQESNCLEIFEAADKYSLKDLRKTSLEFVCDHFEAVARDKLLKLNGSHFEEILKSDKIQALEELIFTRLTEWVQYDEQNRSHCIPDLLELIRFEKFSQMFLLDVVDKCLKKYNLWDLVTRALRERDESDGKATGLYRHTSSAPKNIFIATEAENIFIIQKYNIISNRWDISRTIRIAECSDRVCYGLVLNRSKMYLIGGSPDYGEDNIIRSLVTYDLVSLKKLNRKPIHTARGMIQPILLDDYIYIFGGYGGDDFEVLETCERFSLTSKASEMIEPMQYGRCNYAAAIMNGKIYVAGGDIDPFEYSPCLRLSSVECYDPVDNKWTNVANMNFPRTNFALVESNGMLLAIGHHASVERYDPIRDVWTVIGSFEDSENIITAVNLHNEIYVLAENGMFGKFKADPECTLQPLRSARNESWFTPFLLIN